MGSDGLTSPYNILDFGAEVNGSSACTDAIRAAFDACAARGGGTVYIPAGNFLTGAIAFRSNTVLYLEAGALLRFSTNLSDYPVIPDQWEGHDCDVYSPLIYGKDLENITITGHGAMDGQGAPWWKLYRDKTLLYPRPRMIAFHRCKNVMIDGVRVLNSPNWTVNPVECENVTISNLSICNPADSPTTDGIDPCSCRSVTICNCHIDVGDDCIAIKSGREECPRRIPCENIIVSHCTMVHGHGGIVIGSEMSGDVRNVVVGDCIFQDTDRGLRIKSCRGRGGVVENIQVSNILMLNVVCPFVTNLYYFCGPKGHEKYIWDKSSYPVTGNTPAVRRIRISGITALGVRSTAGFFYGLPEMPVEDIRFDNVSVEMSQEAAPCFPDMLDGLEPVRKKGFFCGNVKNAVFSNIYLSGCEGPAFSMDNVTGASFSNCPGAKETHHPSYVG
jgi:polygalacturonase